MADADGAKCVLIVDSDPLVRAPVAGYLRDCGYRVIESNSVDEAETVLFESSLSVSVVLCDAAAVGVRDALELRRNVARTLPEVAFLLAGSYERVVSLAGDICEDSTYVGHPYDQSIVLDRILRALGSRSSGSCG